MYYDYHQKHYYDYDGSSRDQGCGLLLMILIMNKQTTNNNNNDSHNICCNI